MQKHVIPLSQENVPHFSQLFSDKRTYRLTYGTAGKINISIVYRGLWTRNNSKIPKQNLILYIIY